MATNRGQLTWAHERDVDGHRRYTVTHLVEVTLGNGPRDPATASGLPQTGDPWTYGNDNDLYALCTPEYQVKIHRLKKGQRPEYYAVTNIFTTKPWDRCQDTEITDPLLEPDRIFGGTLKSTVEASADRFGVPLLNSAKERYRGPLVEFDANRPTVTVSQNRADLELALFSSMIDKVNMYQLWGLGTRRLKLSDASWERKVHGVCGYFYVRTFNFDVKFDTFDRFLLDEGSKVLHGKWADLVGVDATCASYTNNKWVLQAMCSDGTNVVQPNPDNPQDFITYKDINGDPGRVILNGHGLPAWSTVTFGTSDGTTGEAGMFHLQYYDEADFLLLGIPPTLP